MPTYSIWGGSVPPDGNPSQSTDSDSLSLGTAFTVSEACNATHVRFYFGSGWTVTGNVPSAVGIYVSGNATPLATVTWAGGDPTTGWNDQAIGPVALSVGTTYVAVVHYVYNTASRYSALSGYFTANRVSGVLTAPGGAAANGLYVYGASIALPTNEFNDSAYYSDVIVDTGAIPYPTQYTKARMRARAY